MRFPRLIFGRCRNCRAFYSIRVMNGQSASKVPYCGDPCRDAYRADLAHEATFGPSAKAVHELFLKVTA